MENLLIIDRQPMLRLGLKLLLASHLPTMRSFEANCRYSIRELFSREKFSIIMLGIDPNREEIRPADIATIRNKFPNTKLIV